MYRKNSKKSRKVRISTKKPSVREFKKTTRIIETPNRTEIIEREERDPQLELFYKNTEKKLYRNPNQKYTFNNYLDDLLTHINNYGSTYQYNLQEQKEKYIELMLDIFEKYIQNKIRIKPLNLETKEELDNYFNNELNDFFKRNEIKSNYFDLTESEKFNYLNEIINKIGQLAERTTEIQKQIIDPLKLKFKEYDDSIIELKRLSDKNKTQDVKELFREIETKFKDFIVGNTLIKAELKKIKKNSRNDDLKKILESVEVKYNIKPITKPTKILTLEPLKKEKEIIDNTIEEMAKESATKMLNELIDDISKTRKYYDEEKFKNYNESYNNIFTKYDDLIKGKYNKDLSKPDISKIKTSIKNLNTEYNKSFKNTGYFKRFILGIKNIEDYEDLLSNLQNELSNAQTYYDENNIQESRNIINKISNNEDYKKLINGIFDEDLKKYGYLKEAKDLIKTYEYYSKTREERKKEEKPFEYYELDDLLDEFQNDILNAQDLLSKQDYKNFEYLFKQINRKFRKFISGEYDKILKENNLLKAKNILLEEYDKLKEPQELLPEEIEREKQESLELQREQEDKLIKEILREQGISSEEETTNIKPITRRLIKSSKPKEIKPKISRYPETIKTKKEKETPYEFYKTYNESSSEEENKPLRKHLIPPRPPMPRYDSPIISEGEREEGQYIFMKPIEKISEVELNKMLKELRNKLNIANKYLKNKDFTNLHAVLGVIERENQKLFNNYYKDELIDFGKSEEFLDLYNQYDYLLDTYVKQTTLEPHEEDIINDIIESHEGSLEGKGLFDVIKKIGRTIKNVFTNTESQLTNKFEKDYQTYSITNGIIYRTPVQSFVQKFLNIITLGQFKQNVQNNYDGVFHLYCIFEMMDDNGKKAWLLTEKTPNIIWEKRSSLATGEKNAESISFSLNKPVNFVDVITQTKNTLGVNFSRYTADKYNCQNWILSLIDSCYKLSGSSTPTDVKEFIYQDPDLLFKGISGARVISNKITSLAHVFGRLTGKAQPERKKAIYCGINNPNKYQRRGTIKECSKLKQLRYYGLHKINEEDNEYKGIPLKSDLREKRLYKNKGMIQGEIEKLKADIADYKYEDKYNKYKKYDEKIKETENNILKLKNKLKKINEKIKEFNEEN